MSLYVVTFLAGLVCGIGVFYLVMYFIYDVESVVLNLSPGEAKLLKILIDKHNSRDHSEPVKLINNITEEELEDERNRYA